MDAEPPSMQRDTLWKNMGEKYRHQCPEISAMLRSLDNGGGIYTYEQLVGLVAEEVCSREGIPLTESYFQGFLACSRLSSSVEAWNEKVKYLNAAKNLPN